MPNKNRVAVIGVGETAFKTNVSEKTYVELAQDAAKAALDDAGLVPDDIDPGEVNSHAVRRLDAVHRPAESGRGGKQRTRHNAVVDHLGWTVDVGEERLQGAYPLHDSRFDQFPFGSRDEPGDQVEREDPFFAAMGKDDALVAEATVPGLRPPRQIVASERLQGVVQGSHVRMRQPIRPEHLVIRETAFVSVEEAAHTWMKDPACYRLLHQLLQRGNKASRLCSSGRSADLCVAPAFQLRL